MGKKNGRITEAGKRKPEKDSAGSDEEDIELEQELAALEAIRAEREAGSSVATASNGAEQKRQRGMYNSEGLEMALAARTDLPFIESYELCEFDIELQDDNDDLAREMAFYNQSMQAVTAGRERLKQLGVPLRRPDDYFAENIKTDVHMARIKDKLLLEKKKMDAFEQRLHREKNRKFNKQLQELKKQEKQDKTKGAIEDFTKLRKKGASGQQIEDKVEQMLGRGEGNRDRTEKSAKRKAYDKKYGSGVKEHMRNKLNDRKSLNDMRDYNPRGGKLVRRDKRGGKPGSIGKPGGGAKKAVGGKAGKFRPGKSKRDAARKGGAK
jgi:rRNA-processing protein EBP2